MPALEFLEALFFLGLSLRIDEHWVGEKTAKTPKTQIALKIEPMSDFRQGTFPDMLGGKAIRSTIISRPRNDRNIRKVISKLHCFLGGMLTTT